jgi:hypothetical protein
MGTLRSRLQWSDEDGAVHDGPRRYLMMRPDVLMGALAAVDGPARTALLDAWAASTCLHGGASLQAYAQQVGGDAQALIDATIAAAADLGWGHWSVQAVQSEAGGLQLQVVNSPFVDGWRAAAGQPAARPVCAPVRGMFTALVGALRPGEARVDEVHCAAMQPGEGGVCTFRIRQETP